MQKIRHYYLFAMNMPYIKKNMLSCTTYPLNNIILMRCCPLRGEDVVKTTH